MGVKTIIKRYKCSSCTTTISLIENEKEIYLWCPKCRKVKKFKEKSQIVFDIKEKL